MPFDAVPASPQGNGLPKTHLRLAVVHAIHDLPVITDLEERLRQVQERLWREDAEGVAHEFWAAYSALALDAMDFLSSDRCGRHGLHAERMRELRRPLPTRPKHGLPLKEIAEQAGMDRETLVSLMEHHGYLELVPYGGKQRRRLVTDQAYAAGLGHNADASNIRIAAVEGMNRATVFPVFYPERVPDILWTLDYEGIVSQTAAIQNKRARLRWLLETYAFLPNAEVARLSGCSLSGVEKSRARKAGSAMFLYEGVPPPVQGQQPEASPGASL